MTIRRFLVEVRDDARMVLVRLDDEGAPQVIASLSGVSVDYGSDGAPRLTVQLEPGWSGQLGMFAGVTVVDDADPAVAVENFLSSIDSGVLNEAVLSALGSLGNRGPLSTAEAFLHVLRLFARGEIPSGA